MNVLKHFLYIQYGCEEEMSVFLQPLFHPTIPRLLVPKFWSAWPEVKQCRGHPYAYPQHMNVLKHFLYILYGCGEEVNNIVQPQSY